MSNIITSSDGADLVYQMLDASLLKNEINGKIYRGTRPDDSEVEDIVILPLPLIPGSTATMFCNINIFVPDIQSGTKHWQPDTARLSTLSKMAMDLFKEVQTPAFTIIVEENSDSNPLPTIRQHWAYLRLFIAITEHINF